MEKYLYLSYKYYNLFLKYYMKKYLYLSYKY